MTIVVNHISVHLVLCLIWTAGALAAGNLTAYLMQGGRIIIMWASQAFFFFTLSLQKQGKYFTHLLDNCLINTVLCELLQSTFLRLMQLQQLLQLPGCLLGDAYSQKNNTENIC